MDKHSPAFTKWLDAYYMAGQDKLTVQGLWDSWQEGRRNATPELQAEVSRLTENQLLQDSATAAVMERAERAEADAARWRKVEAMMVHQRCGPNFGWTIDTLLEGDSPTDAIDAAIAARKEGS